jgi:hypothetical protein
VGIALLVLAGEVVDGQESAKVADADPVVWLDQVRPKVEEVLGYKLPASPRLQLIGAAQLRSVPDADVATHLRWRFPHLKEDAFGRALDDASAVNNAATVARLMEGSNVIFVCPENQSKLARWDPSLQEAAGPEFLHLALIHETVRYALDSRYDLKKRRDSCRDSEEWLTLETLVQGWSHLVTRRLSRQLGLERSFPLLAERYLHVPDVSPDPGLRLMSQSAVRQRFWACTQGCEFFKHLEQLGMADMEKRVFSNPPRVLKWISRPDLFARAEREHRPDLSATLEQLKAALPASDWSLAPQEWTPAMVIQAAGLLGEQHRAERVVASWDEGRSLVWTQKTNPARQIAISLVRLETAAAARAYFGFAVELHRKRDQLSNNPCGLPLRVIDARSHTVSLRGVEEAVVNDKKLQPANSSALITSRVLLAHVGDRVIEITWHGTPGDLAWAQQVLEVLQAGVSRTAPNERFP